MMHFANSSVGVIWAEPLARVVWQELEGFGRANKTGHFASRLWVRQGATGDDWDGNFA